MIKRFVTLFFLSSRVFASFSVGYSSYGSTFSTNVYNYQGTLTSLVTAQASSSGPVAVFTFNFPQNASNTIQYKNGLAALLFKSPPLEQILYSTNYSLSQFKLQKLASQSVLTFVETNGSQQRILSSFINNTSGVFGTTPLQAFPFQGFPFTNVTVGQASANTLVINALSGPYANSTNMLYSKRGTFNGFNQIATSLVSPFSNPLYLTQTSNSSVSTTAFVQNNYGNINTNYVLESGSGMSNPVRISDSYQTGCQFLSFNNTGNVLFVADSTILGTMRLGASEIASSGALTPFNYITQNYSYNSSIPLTFAQDSLNNQYIIFNGAATTYSTNNLQIGVYNTSSHSWKAVLQGPSLFISNTNPCQYTPISKGLMLTELSNGLYFTATSSTNFLGQTTISSTPTFITGYNISSAILNNTSFTFSTITTLNQTYSTASGTIVGSISPFYNVPSYTSTADSNGNVVFAFSGYTAYNNLIFSNVYNNSLNTYTGQILMNGVYGSPTQGSSYPSITFYGTTTPPTAISTPTLINSSGNIACVWSQNVGGIYTIYGALYQPLKFSFTSPVQIATGFSTMPSILAVPGLSGFIFAGNN